MLYSNYNPERIYVGITKMETLQKRLVKHKNNYHQHLKNQNTFCTSFKILNDYGVDNLHIELLDETYNSKDEYWWIELLSTENKVRNDFNKNEYIKKYNKNDKFKIYLKNYDAKRSALNYLKKLFN